MTQPLDSPETQAALSAAWHTILAQASPLHLEAQAMCDALAGQTLTLLAAAAVFEAGALGTTLADLDGVQVQHFTQLQVALGEVCDGIAPAALARFQAELAAGFYLRKAAAARQYNMDAATMMGHDLKTPINAITGFSKVILKGIDGPINEMQHEDLTSIFNAGQKLLSLIHDLFEVMKVDAAKTPLYDGPYAVASLLGDVVGVMQPRLADAGHTLILRCVGDLGELYDAALFVRWIALALVLQAMQGAASGELTLTASTQQREGVSTLTLAVTHTNPPQGEARTAAMDVHSSLHLFTAQTFCTELHGALEIGLEGGKFIFRAHIPMSG